MRALWLVNLLWVIVPVNPRKNRASSYHRDGMLVKEREFVNHSPATRGLQILLAFYQHPAWFISFYYMATIVHALCLAADRALFSSNDRALWNFFSAWRLFWVVSKTTCAWAKTTENMDKIQLYFQQLKEKLAYGYFFRRGALGFSVLRF